MRKILVFLFLFLSPLVYSQTEFFGNHSGISLGYLHGFGHDFGNASSVAMSIYSESGFESAIGVQKVNSQSYPIFGLAYYIRAGSEKKYPFAAIGLSYANPPGLGLMGLSFTLIGCIEPDSNFPLSLHGSITGQSNLFSSELGKIDVMTIIGFGYNQAFFAKRSVYPSISITSSIEPKSFTYLFAGAISLNIRFSNKEEKNREREVQQY